LQLTKKDGSIIHTICSVAFKPLGSLSASCPKQLSPIELDNDDGIDVNLDETAIPIPNQDGVGFHRVKEARNDKQGRLLQG
jgi:hypothetical protein